MEDTNKYKMVAVIGNREVGTIQSLHCSITREVVIEVGEDGITPRYKKGRRGIAGTLIFSQLDRTYLVNTFPIGEMPEFDIVGTCENEDGFDKSFRVEGVQLVNEGWGFTPEGIDARVPITYVARDYHPPTK